MTMSRIRSFLYRLPRFPVNCRMDFIHGDAVILGTCTNLSESGLRGVFSEYVAPGSIGLLTLYCSEERFEVQAKIYSIRDEEARVRFNFANDKERANLTNLLKAFSSRPVS